MLINLCIKIQLLIFKIGFTINGDIWLYIHGHLWFEVFFTCFVKVKWASHLNLIKIYFFF